MTILLRSGWQSVNIGDIVHTAGFLQMARKYLPNAEIIAWVSDDFPAEEREMFTRHYPEIEIVMGTISEDGQVSTAALARAMEKADVLIHNSGPMLVAKDDVEAFHRLTGKPFGAWGITYDGNDYYTACFEQASFLYFRDPASLEIARRKGIRCPVMGFCPDIAFFADLEDAARSGETLERYQLRKGQFLCCIPRLRYTPFWEIKPGVPFNPERQEINARKKDADHRWLRETITRVVRERHQKVLICPEDKSQMALEKPLLYDLLPEDVKPMVSCKETFWLPDEAIGVYRQSAGLFGNEMHSPILCIANGVPAVVCRWKEQTTKGLMWNTLGLGEWLFDTDDPERMKELPDTVLHMIDHPAEAKAKVARAMELVDAYTRQTVDALHQVLSQG